MADIRTVAVLGAGTMGSGIAHVFARTGFNVLLCDVEQRFLDRALALIRANLGREAAKGKFPVTEIEPAMARITSTTDRELLARADFAVEAASERYELKSGAFPVPRPHPSHRGRSRHQHLVHLHHQACSANQPPSSSDRHAFL